MSAELEFHTIAILGMVVFFQGCTEGNNKIDCPSTQFVELGSRGSISCTFPSGLTEVHWYDDVSGSRVPAIAAYEFYDDADAKFGSGIDSGEYDIFLNGTLVISNVSLNHERHYRVLACTDRCNHVSTVSVKVIVYPREVSPSIASCDDVIPCVVSFTKAGHLTCQFDSARPPVGLEWVGKHNGDDIQIERQTSFNELNSDDFTLKSYAVFNKTVGSDRLLAIYSCRASWVFPGLVGERKILVDFSEEFELLNITLEETVNYEINRRSELRCKVSNLSKVIWKKISPSGSIETVGFYFEGVVHTKEGFSDDVSLSTDGRLIFTSLQLHHEGTYACIYDNGRGVKGMQGRYLQVLVPPSPPYIQIEECKEKDPCIFRGKRKGSLTCVMDGVRPEVSLTWISTNDKLVTIKALKTVIQHIGQLTYVSTSVNYELAPDMVCGHSVELKCQVGLPISQIIQPSVKTVIYAGECDYDDGRNEAHGFPAFVVVLIVLLAACLLGMGVYFTIYCFMKYIKRSSEAEDQQSTDSAVDASNPMLKDSTLIKLNENGVGHFRENGQTDDKPKEVSTNHEIKIPFQPANGNGVLI